MASRYKILRDQVEPQPPKPVQSKIIPTKRTMIRAREIGSLNHWNWAEEVNLITNLKIVQRDLIVHSNPKIARDKLKEYSEKHELIRVEYDIINPTGDWEQKYFKRRQKIPHLDKFSYDNEFQIIYPESQNSLKNLNVEALKEHLQTYYAEEFSKAMDQVGEYQK